MDDLSTAPHQLATLTPLRLTVFARSLVQPPPSPSSSTSPPLSAAYLDRLQDVLVLTVDLKLVALASQCSWNPFTNPRRSQLDDWVRTLLQAFTTAGSTELVAADDACKVAALGGLYKGLTAAGTSKGLRRDVEIELLVAVEIGLDAVLKVRSEGKGKAREDGLDHPPTILHAAASLLPMLPRSSVRVLNTPNLIRLSTDSVDSTTSKADLDALAAIVTSSLKALAVDRLQLDRLRSSASELTTSLLDLCSSSTNTESDLSTLFFSFIAPVSSVLADLLLSAPFRPAVAQRISHNLLLVIHRWAEMIDQAGGLDGDYEVGKTWWTVVDVLMSRNWTDDKRVKVLQDMANASHSSAEDNLVLLLAEQVIGGSSLKRLLPVLNDVVVPICHRYLNDKSHLEAFESSHSVVLAILNKPLRRSAEGQSPPAVKTFIQALLQNYFGILLQNTDSAQLTIDQLQHAFPIVVQRAGDNSPSLLSTFLDTLSERVRTSTLSPELQQTYLLLFASVLPSIPVSLLPTYLDSLGQQITSRTRANTAERGAVVSFVWERISKDLGDEGKLIGVEWWLAFERKISSTQQVKAKL